VKVDAAAWRIVVASIYREWDEKDIPQESVPGISPTQESISSQRSIQAFKIAVTSPVISNLKCPCIIFYV
jgi:hypothetical protein